MAITILREGARSPEVVDLQYLLLFRGNVTEAELGYADGVFGPKTKASVLKFQRAKGLIVDGIVGSQTWSALAPIGQWPNRIAGDFLREGDTGAGVKALQQGLKFKQAYNGAVDGIFGPITKAAVIQMQRTGTPSTNVVGVVGPLTFGGAIGG
jgi:peptidoglycan hydrolase-like protein with peptidoglycan-binding domain